MPPSVGPIYTYTDPSCGDWFSILTRLPKELDMLVSPPDGAIYLNETFLKDPENYECVSQDIYQWVSNYPPQYHVISTSFVSSQLPSYLGFLLRMASDCHLY
jgi:hypothetical protein